MDATLSYLLMDAWQRRREYFLLAAVFSLLTAVSIAGKREFQMTTCALAIIMWMNIPPFVFRKSHRALAALPLSKFQIGRMMWWMSCGACALVSSVLLIVSLLLANAFGQFPLDVGASLRWTIEIAGLSGHGLALVVNQASTAQRDPMNGASWRFRALQGIAGLYLAVIVAIVFVWKDSAAARVILVLSGYAVAMVGFMHSESLADALLPMPTRTERARDVEWQPSSHYVAAAMRRIRDNWQQFYSTLIIAVAILWVLGSGDTQISSAVPRFLGTMAATFACLSGVFVTSKWLVSLHALRALPISGSRLAAQLTLKAITPTAIYCGVASILNPLLHLAPPLTILALAVYLGGSQSLWPGFLLNDIAATSTKRVLLIVGGVIWAMGGGAMILVGFNSLAWVAGPMLGLGGYLWTRHTIYTSKFAYRSPGSVSNDSGFLQLDR